MDNLLKSTERISYQISNCLAVKQATEQMELQIAEANTEEEKEELRNQLQGTLDLLR